MPVDRRVTPGLARALMVAGLLWLVLSLGWMPVQAAACGPTAAASGSSMTMVAMAGPAAPGHRCRACCPGCGPGGSCVAGQAWLQATATTPARPGSAAGLAYAALPVRDAHDAARPPDVPPPRGRG